ncbi:hypothetical protein, partial [Paraburkholderia sp. EG304]|uniref:hypothetical protein n=1 Tax=Paraburkholderia sp. EG304 TaxID=3237015 RepID=UPI0039789889
IAPRPFAVPLETRTFVSFHRQRLLLHPVLPSLSTPLYNAPSSYAVDLISNALTLMRRSSSSARRASVCSVSFEGSLRCTQ